MRIRALLLSTVLVLALGAGGLAGAAASPDGPRGDAWAVREMERRSTVPTTREHVVDLFLLADGASQVQVSHYSDFPPETTKTRKLSDLDAYEGDLRGFGAGYRMAWDMRWEPNPAGGPPDNELGYMRIIYLRFLTGEGVQSRHFTLAVLFDREKPRLIRDDPVRLDSYTEEEQTPLRVCLLFTEQLRESPQLTIVEAPEFPILESYPGGGLRAMGYCYLSRWYLDRLGGGEGDYTLRISNIVDTAGNEADPVEAGPVRIRKGHLVETELVVR